MKTYAPLFVVGACTVFLVHCATGSVLDAESSGGFGETGGGWGMGGNATGGNGSGATGQGSVASGPSSASSGGMGGAGPGSGGASASSSGVGASASSSAASSTAASSSSSAVASSSAASSSSSGGGPVDCNPLSPGGVCSPSEHCFPQPDGNPTCEGPVGAGGTYSACLDPGDCQAALNCIDTGDIFASPCCLSWCTSAAQCPAGSTCEFLATHVYVNGVEYGVCFDGIGGC